MKKYFQNIAALFLVVSVSLSVVGINIAGHECGETGEKHPSLQLAGHDNAESGGDDCPCCAIEQESCCEMEDMQQENESDGCKEGSSGDIDVELKKDLCCIEYSDYLANQFDIKLNDESNSNNTPLKIIREVIYSAIFHDFNNDTPSTKRPLRLPYGDTYLQFIGVMLS